MGYKLKIKYNNSEGEGEIILTDSNKLKATGIVLNNANAGPALIDLIRKLTSWMSKNNIHSLEIEEE